MLALMGFAPGCARSKADSSGLAPPMSEQKSNKEPEPIRQGLSAGLIWKQPTANPNAGGACSTELPTLVATEIRADNRRLYVDVVHSSPGKFDSYQADPIGVDTLVNGCPVKIQPVANGRVWRDWASPTSATVEIDALPDGEIELALKAFGQHASLPILLKKGRTITQINRKESSRYVYFPADPKRGLEAASTMIQPDCMQEISESKR